MGLRIVVGSTSEIKLAAVREACRQLGLEAEVSGLKGRSLVQEQPVGLRMTTVAARYRAAHVERLLPGVIGVGIENGIERRGEETVDFGVVVVLNPDLPGGIAIEQTEAVAFPAWAVHLSKLSGFRKTVGQVIAEANRQCQHNDPHSWLTNGAKPRVKLLTAALVRALQPLVGK